MVKSISNSAGNFSPPKIKKPEQPFAKALDNIKTEKKADKPTNSPNSASSTPKVDEPNSNTTIKEKVHSVFGHFRAGTSNNGMSGKKDDKASLKSDEKDDKASLKSDEKDDKASLKSDKKDDKASLKSDKKDDDKASVKADKKDDDKKNAFKLDKQDEDKASAKIKQREKEATDRIKKQEEESIARIKKQEAKAAAKIKMKEMLAEAKLKMKEAKVAAKLAKQEAKLAKLEVKRDVVNEFILGKENADRQSSKGNQSRLVVLPQELLDELKKPLVPLGKKNPPLPPLPGNPGLPTPPTNQKPRTFTQELFRDISNRYFAGGTPASSSFGLQFTSGF